MFISVTLISFTPSISLQRVHNSLIKNYFKSFDARGHFVPDSILSYVYPLDQFSQCNFGDKTGSVGTEKDGADEPKASPELEQSLAAINKGVKEIGRRLLVPLSELNMQQHGTGDDALSMVSSLSSEIQKMSMESTPAQDNISATTSLEKLYNFHVKINALLWTRTTNKQHKDNIKYSLGQIVKHKVYGFRGMVGAWDAKPKMDVSNWDGLRDIVNPQEKPFYHLYADVNDCIQAFGGPRNYRYVCQDNLELNQQNEKLEFDVDLDPEEWKWDGEQGVYIPSAEMKVSSFVITCSIYCVDKSDTLSILRTKCKKFMFGESMGENEPILLATLRNLKVSRAKSYCI